MAVDGNFRPTLLVGVGGTGSKIAETILQQALTNEDSLSSRIGIMAIDTDINDLNELSAVNQRSRIQFSRPETVHRLLERNRDVEGDWCYSLKAPEMSEAIKGMSLIEGAGQIRMLTRLALHDGFQHQNLMGRFEAVISDLAVHANDQGYDGAIHVLVVGSLAGATGSGSFTQIALGLNDAARNRGVAATVRGVFLLPDVYARSGVLPSTQHPNVLANGYASLKELNAINIRTTLPHRRTNFRFEYAPGKQLMDGSAPYAAITFIDYENSRGGNMGRNLPAYIEMAARAGYLMIFSPLGARYGSVTINDVRQKLAAIASGSTNLYSGIGISAVNYPADSMRRFLGRSLMLESLQGDWTRLDIAYKQQVARYKSDLQAGQTSSEKPDIRVTYVRDLEQLAKAEPRVPFFRRAYDYLFPEVEDEKTRERTVHPRHRRYADAVVDYVRSAFWADSDLRSVYQRGNIDTSSVLESDSIVDTTRRAESDLDRDWRTLEAALQGRPEDIVHNELVSADKLGQGEWAPHHIQNHIVDDAPHPVTVRAFLYHIRQEFMQRRDGIDVRDLRLKLFRIANQFRTEDEQSATNNRPTSRSTATVIERASQVEASSAISNIFGGKRKAFAGEYVEFYNTSVRQMRGYANAVIEYKVCDQLLTEVEGLIRVFEGLFAEIEDIGERLGTEIATEKKTYDGSGGFDGNSFVYADAACKDDAWERVQEATAGLRVDDRVNQNLVSTVYKMHRANKRERAELSFKEINALFWSQVVEGFGQNTIDRDFSSYFDFSVIEAMRRQFEVEDKAAAAEAARTDQQGPPPRPAAERMKEIVDRVSRQSEPYLSFVSPDSDGTPIKFWTVHPSAQKAINDDDLFSQMFRFSDGDNPIIKEEFSEYELICVNLRVNVELTMMAKLNMGDENARSVHSPTEGRLVTPYNEMIARMTDAKRSKAAGAEFTPHVDRTWHTPGVLPEIFSHLEEKIEANNSKGYVVALTHDLIKLDVEHDEPIARFSTLGRGISNAVDETFSRSHNPWTLYQEFVGNVPMVESAVQYWDMVSNEEAGSVKAHESYAKLASPELLLTLLKPATIRNDEPDRRDDAAIAILGSWIECLGELITRQDHSLTPRAQDLALKKEVSEIRDRFFELAAAEGYQREILRVLERVFGISYDKRFS